MHSNEQIQWSSACLHGAFYIYVRARRISMVWGYSSEGRRRQRGQNLSYYYSRCIYRFLMTAGHGWAAGAFPHICTHTSIVCVRCGYKWAKTKHQPRRHKLFNFTATIVYKNQQSLLPTSTQSVVCDNNDWIKHFSSGPDAFSFCDTNGPKWEKQDDVYVRGFDKLVSTDATFSSFCGRRSSLPVRGGCGDGWNTTIGSRRHGHIVNKCIKNVKRCI
jgi:hypothetical protein